MTTKEYEEEMVALYTYFKTAKFPEIPFKLNNYITVVGNPSVFIDGEILRIKSYQGSEYVRDSLFRHLRELRAICEKIV